MAEDLPVPSRVDLVVVGAGIIGLSIARQLSRRGVTVLVADPRPDGGATWASAGMLAPVTEAHFGEETLLQLTLASSRLYPEFVDDVERASGESCGYRRCGTLSVAFDSGDRAVLDDLRALHVAQGLHAQSLSPRRCRELEPLLVPSVAGGVIVDGDHQVEPRLLAGALRTACRRSGVRFACRAVTALSQGTGGVRGVRLAGGDEVEATDVVLAAGCWSRELASSAGVDVPVRPVKGQILTLRPPSASRSSGLSGSSLLSRNIRCIVEGRPVYLVPRSDGRIILGATNEERGFDTEVTVDALHQLLHDARLVVPAISELVVVEFLAGLRPGSPDNGPLIGTTGDAHLHVATGHYRNGILLAPITADAIADLLTTGSVPEVVVPFSPRRFNSDVAR